MSNCSSNTSVKSCVRLGYESKVCFWQLVFSYSKYLTEFLRGGVMIKIRTFFNLRTFRLSENVDQDNYENLEI